MKVIGVDTATSEASVALVENGALVCEQTSSQSSRTPGGPRPHHAEVLIPLLETVLRRASVAFGQISGLAVSIGPGSFTGLRIGLSTVKGLTYESGIPVAGVSTLLASAFRVSGWEGLISPILDARKNEIYRCLFRRSGDRLDRIVKESVGSPESWLATVAGHAEHGERILFVGDGVPRFGELIRRSLGDRAVLAAGESYRSIGFAVARLGEERLLESGGDPLGQLEPIYLRPSEAELHQR